MWHSIFCEGLSLWTPIVMVELSIAGYNTL